LLGTPADEILRISAKAGVNVDAVLEAIVEQIPPPRGAENLPPRALIFDSHYDSYKGVVAYVRVMEGRIRANDTLRLMATRAELEPFVVIPCDISATLCLKICRVV
jgi:GTP-binding protein LepA